MISDLLIKQEKEIWVADANRYRNPEVDLPLEFEENRQEYYDATTFPWMLYPYLQVAERIAQQVGSMESIRRSKDGLKR